MNYTHCFIFRKGLNSRLPLQPVIRPEVQRMLCEEFYPPLHSVTATNNTGVLIITNLREWIKYNFDVKRAKLKEAADALRRRKVTKI